MRGITEAIAILGATVVLAGATADAHHSAAMFDMNKCRTLAGTVRTFQFQFPHSWLWVVVPGSKGGTDIWALESAAPAQMSEIDVRWRRDVVQKGDRVTVMFSPMRDGRTGGALAKLTLPNGTVLRAATPACAKELAPPTPQ